MTKICTTCKIEKEFNNENFHFRDRKKKILRASCKMCECEKKRKYYISHREKLLGGHKKWYIKNKEKIAKISKIYQNKNKVKIKIQRHKHYVENKSRILKRVKIYRLKHIKKYRIYHNQYGIKRRKTDIKFRLHTSMCGSITDALKKCNHKKNNLSWLKFVDYTLEELKNHLELTMTPEMTWQQYLDGKLSIDHILPVSLFDYKLPNDILFKYCWELKNLRLLDKNKNTKKNDFLPDGRRARDLNSEEKIDYLKTLGYKF